MSLHLNKFVIINILCVFIFVASLLGVLDWAIASVILILGIGLSTFFGSLFYSKKYIDDIACRLVFSVGVLSIGYVFFKIGEYLNKNIYDGLVTFLVIAYVFLATILLQYLGRKTT